MGRWCCRDLRGRQGHGGVHAREARGRLDHTSDEGEEVLPPGRERQGLESGLEQTIANHLGQNQSPSEKKVAWKGFGVKKNLNILLLHTSRNENKFGSI